MEQDELIPVKDLCIYHNIEYSFIDSLENSGLISVTSIEHTAFIPLDDVRKLEKFVRLHYDLDINMEGIETINYLLEKMEEMQKQILKLRNELPDQQGENA